MNFHVSPQKAAQELLRRRLARRGLIDFTRYTFPRYRPADHHYQIAEKLESVALGKIKRLMIFVPPRHGKSELASRRFPAFVLGTNPLRNFIAASYNSDLANDFGREVRNLIKSEEYQALFEECRLASDSGAADRWHTDKGGSYVAAGIGTAVTGRGAHIFMIDDPVKDREAATSETVKRKTYEWYTSTAYTRLESEIQEEIAPDDWLWDVGGAVRDGLVEPFEGAIVVIQTRWADDDLAGHLIEDMENGADQWDILELPAIKDGNALWPAKYPIDRLQDIKKAIGPRDFSALYQQNPVPDDGDYFRSEWFRPYHKAPERSTLLLYGASDYAVTDNGGDYTVHVVVGVDTEKRLWLMDVWRDQTDSGKWVEAFCDLVKEWKPLMWAEETGQIRSGIGPFLVERMRKRQAYVHREAFPTRGDKAVRSQSIRGRMSIDGLYVPVNAPWWPEFKKELLRFPAGKHDDQVDALGLIGQLLDRVLAAMAEPKEEHKLPNDYRPMTRDTSSDNDGLFT